MTHKSIGVFGINEHMAKTGPFALWYLTIQKCFQLLLFS